MQKVTIIHHSADFDGIFCREIPKQFLLNPLTIIGWDYRDDKIPFPNEGLVYVLDLSPSCFIDLPISAHSRLIWIDHHKTSIDEWEHENFKGYRIDGVAACRLTWQWFQSADLNNEICIEDLPAKQDFIDRKVIEPLSVRLAGEYDIWDKRDEMAETFQFGLRSKKLTKSDWKFLLSIDDLDLVYSLLKDGGLLQSYQQESDRSNLNRGYIKEFEGLKFLTLNTSRCNSLTFMSKDVPSTGHDALMGYFFDGKKWNYSLYHAKHRTDLDLSVIAKKYGGGGHRGACGFQQLQMI